MIEDNYPSPSSLENKARKQLLIIKWHHDKIILFRSLHDFLKDNLSILAEMQWPFT